MIGVLGITGPAWYQGFLEWLPDGKLFSIRAVFYYLSSPSRYLTKNILSSIVKISKLFYFGLKFSVKSAYKTNTLC
ncbi:hypothetical protein [Streptococcus suis]|uniref:hypothetical protein n=1 Tax=Streptococcus suis TaxID=1307 RepID=UPI001EDDA5F3|nr:hypothetical protein [Streptococcus suis]